MRLKAVPILAVQAGSAVQPPGAVFLLSSLGFTACRGSQPLLTEAALHCLILWVDESISYSLVACMEKSV